MAPTISIRILQALGVAALVTSAVSPGGNIEPSHIRTATIGGVRGPVYYSAIDGSYHPVGQRTDRPAAQQVAEALLPKP